MIQITCVKAKDFTEEVEDYCIDNEIQIHYQNDIALVEDDDNPFALWLKSKGYEFKEESDYIGIIST